MTSVPFRLSLLLLILLTSANFSFSQVGQIIWEEQFNSIDADSWNVVSGDGCMEDNCGWGRQELEYYKEDNAYVEAISGEAGNYALVLEAKAETIEGNSFSSGKISSEDKLAIKYGLIELRIKTPDVETGLWPAASLLGTNHKAVGWPASGEFDIMEMGHKAAEISRLGHDGVSPNNYVGANLLWYNEESCDDQNQACAASIANDKYFNNPYVSETALSERFLIYRLYWDEKAIRFTVEDQGVEYDLYNGSIPIGPSEAAFTKPFHFLLNLAVGGDFTDAANAGDVTATLPAKMYIDYIRVRKWNGKGEVFTQNDLLANAGANQKVAIDENVILNAGGSFGMIESYSWTANGVEIATGVNPTVSLEAGSHDVTLKITDSDGNYDTDQIVVTVGDELIGELIWEEQFNTLNSNLWTKTTGDGCDEGICGWGNQELEYYNEDNVYIEEIPGEDGNFALVLEARKEAIGSSEFTSGKVSTEDKLAIKYGVVEVRMMVPDLNAGLWPAAWMLGTNHSEVGWPECGEIDLMEMGHSAAARANEGYPGVSPNNFVGANLLWYSSGACSSENSSCAASIAYDTYYSTPYVSASPMNDRFMTYRLYWDETSIRFTAIDNGTEYDLYTNAFPIGTNESVFQQPYYFILNLAVGGIFTGIGTQDGITAPMPAKMYVDYVKVSKWNGKGEVSYGGGSILANAGPDQIYTDENQNGSEDVLLKASDHVGNAVSYEWFEGGAQIAKGDSVIVNLLNGVHYINLIVTDDEGNTASDETRVEIRKIIWEDNFDTFNTTNWTADIGDGCDQGLCGWGNQELQYYSENNISIEEIDGEPGNNALVIEARKETMGTRAFTSGKITTSSKINLRYGLYEVRMKSPLVETGLWPAAWLLGSNNSIVGWPQSGEIDMMEMGHKASERARQGFEGVSSNNYVGANLIWYDDGACSPDNLNCAASIANDHWYDLPYVSSTPLNDRFQIFRLYWDDRSIRFTVEDGGMELDLYTGPFPISGSSAAFREPFYFLLNLAVGGNFTDAATDAQVTAALPAKMYVDYLRVTTYNGKGEVFDSKGLVANAGPDAIILDENGDGVEQLILDGSASSDYNGSIVSYSWSLEGNIIATEALPTLELPRGNHSIILTVTDNDDNMASDTVHVNITTGGLGPLADAGPDASYTDDDGDDMVSVSLDGSSSTPAGSSIVSYSWRENGVEFASGVSYTGVFSTGVHLITLVLTDEEGLQGEDRVTITIIDPDNIAPIADAGPDFSVDDTDGDDIASVDLDGSGSSDSDGTIESYSWWEAGTLLAESMVTSVDLTTGEHTLTLVISDDDGISSSDEIIITVVDPDNIPPVAHAGEDVKVIDSDRSGSQEYTLDASGSTDSDGVIESYIWKENDLQIASGVSASLDFSSGEHIITLILTDDDGDSSSDELIIKVHQEPIADAGQDILQADSDDNGSEDIQLDASLSNDPLGALVAFRWTENETEIATGVNPIVSFDIGTHILTLEVTDDDGAKDSDEVIIVIASPGNVPPVANAGEDIEIVDIEGNERETVSFDASGSTDSDGSIFTYSWIENDLEIASGITAEAELTLGEHSIVLKVTDNEGAIDTDTVKVAVNAACSFEACTGDFKTIVSSLDANNTMITFYPLKDGIGESLCLLYYGKTDPFPGSGVTPFVPVKMNGLTMGEEVTFYYTYSVPAGQNSTVDCRTSFVVGACDQKKPIADAGPDQVLPDLDGDGSESVSLDGSGSNDPDGSLVSYEWKEGSNQIASGESPTINLSVGSHKLTLIVTDDYGLTDKDDVSIEVQSADGINEISSAIEIAVYPSPMKDILNISSNRGSIERIQLYNSLGVKLMDEVFETRLYVKNIPAGLYIVFATIDGKTVSKVVIKN